MTQIESAQELETLDTSHIGYVRSSAPGEDIEFFRKLNETFSDYTWTHASVDWLMGLPLAAQKEKGENLRFHFRNSLCGRKGASANATITIVKEAGFGYLSDIYEEVTKNNRCSFSKKPALAL